MTNKFLSIHEPVLKGNEKKYINECINDGWVSTSGKFINKFENKIKKFTKSKYVLCLNSCTSALHLSIKALNIQKNDEIITPTITFVSPINAILYNFSIPVFMDCDQYFNIDIEKTVDFLSKETVTKYINNKKVTINKKTKRKIAALLVVHTFGNAVDILNLIKICREKNIKIIEDAAESLGSYYKNKNQKNHLGSIGDIGCISFNGNKIMTSGGGGAILTNNVKYYEIAKHLSSQSKSDQVYFKHDQLGYNYRINNLQSAIGLAQIEKINMFLKQKKIIYNKYKEFFTKIDGLNIMLNPPYSISNNWINILKISNKKINQEKIFNIFNKNKIQTRSVWLPNHKHPYLNKYQTYHIENAFKLFKSSICLPSSANLKKQDLYRVMEIILNIKNLYDR